jgi:hypothetical protein
LLGLPVGRLHAGPGEEREQVLAFGLKVGEQTTVRLMRGTDLQQLVGPLVEVCDLQAELLSVDDIALVAERERVFEDPAGGVRDARLPSDGVGDQLPIRIRECGEPVKVVEYSNALAWLTRLDVGSVGFMASEDATQKAPDRSAPAARRVGGEAIAHPSSLARTVREPSSPPTCSPSSTPPGH